jgi:hypothetical protein
MFVCMTMTACYHSFVNCKPLSLYTSSVSPHSDIIYIMNMCVCVCVCVSLNFL